MNKLLDLKGRGLLFAKLNNLFQRELGYKSGVEPQ